MKKFFVTILFGIILLTGCQTEEVAYDEKIIGYWMDVNGDTISFTGDTCTINDETFTYKVYDKNRLQLYNKTLLGDYTKEYIIDFDGKGDLSLTLADMSSTKTYTKDLEEQKTIIYNKKFGVYEEQFEDMQINEKYRPFLDLCIEKKQLNDGKDYYYFLYDINGDDLPEMFMESSTCEADKKCEVYLLNNDKVKLIGEFGYGYLCGLKEDAILSVYQHMDYQHIEKYFIKNGKLASEILIQGETDNYCELKELTTYSLDEVYGLDWNGNVSTLNDEILDIYINGPTEVEKVKAISDENIYNVLDIKNDGTWGDDGIFNAFCESEFEVGEYTWEYIGDIYGQLIPDDNDYGIVGYEVYRLAYKDSRESEYYFVPVNGYTSMPTVYFYEDGELNMIWCGDV